MSTKGDRIDYLSTGHLTSDLKRRSVRGGAITLSGQGISFVAQVGSTMVLARVLVPSDYGLVAMVVAVTGFLTLFKDLGLSAATVQSPDITQEQVSALFWINGAVSVLLALIIAAIAPALAAMYHEPRLVGITLVTAIGFVFAGFGVQHQALLQRQMQFGVLTAIRLISLGTSIVLGVSLAVLGARYWALVAMPIVVSACTTAGNWIMCSWRPSRPRRHGHVRKMLAFGGHLTGFNTVNYFARNMDNILIGWRWGALALGFYSKAYQLLLLPLQQLNAPVTSVAIPALSRIVGDDERYRRAYVEVLEKLSIMTIPLVAFLMGTSDWVIDVVLGPRWHSAAHIFLWLAVSGLVHPIASTTGWLFITQRSTRELFYWGLMGSTISVLSFIVGLPYGAVGVAAAYGVSGLLVSTPLLVWYVGRSGPVSAADMYRASIRPLLMAGGVLCGVILLRWLSPGVSSLIHLLLAAVVSFALLVPWLALTRVGKDVVSDFRHLLRPTSSASA